MQPPVSLTFIHALVILPYISNTIYWTNVIPVIVNQSDTANGLMLLIGHCDIHFMVQ